MEFSSRGALKSLFDSRKELFVMNCFVYGNIDHMYV